MARIIGLDPGLQTTGYGILDVTDAGPRVCEAGVIRSAAGRDPADMARRVKVLYDGLVEVLDQWKPTIMVVEQLYAHYDHPRTAILMAHARGCFFLAGAQKGIDVLSYPSTRVKKTITGHGRAGKEQIQAAITRELGLARAPEPHDVSDALAIALCHYYTTAKTITTGSRSVTFTGVNRSALFGDEENSPQINTDEDGSEEE
ncbi:crossover junction endodeoxyribonuclease RuvC [Fimbriiglobus ruber]|uniref:Crossover junction endodeoxyribonuclease RuvC n=1 Tax=Fimbriiglobus ruber TaxID=1908690 RepID=A0A225D0Q6_9BACT|nr:crossover junction endodeoxyribonuclease RuvC [Fimbriiglobus ruber]OWK34513.1 Crossover junction endodeoxyribonuclease RuvC [Fimbriiglobus ruber]